MTTRGSTHRLEVGYNNNKYTFLYINSNSFVNGETSNNNEGIGYHYTQNELSPKISLYHENTYLLDISDVITAGDFMLIGEAVDDINSLYSTNVEYLARDTSGIDPLPFSTSTSFGSGASASVSQTGGVIDTSVTIENGGSNYGGTVTVSIVDRDGNGSGATATATISAGAIDSIAITGGGTGYTDPIVIIGDIIKITPTADTPDLYYFSNGGVGRGGEFPNGTELIDAKILLNLDISGSVVTNEWRLIRDGIVAGWQDSRIEKFVRKGGYRRVLFAIQQWDANQYLVMNWVLVDLSDVDVKFHQLSPAKINGENTNSFAATVGYIIDTNIIRVGEGNTNNARALNTAAALFYNELGCKYKASRNEIIHVPDADTFNAGTNPETPDWIDSLENVYINRVNVIAIDKAKGEDDFLNPGTKTTAHTASETRMTTDYTNGNLSPWVYTMEAQKATGPTGRSRYINTFEEFADTFVLALEGAITNTIPCLLEGTIITTDQGDIPIEKLTINNTIRGMKLALVDFSYTESVNICKIPKNWFGENKPSNDLFITKGHAIARDFNKPNNLKKDYMSAGKFSFNKLENNLKTEKKHKVYHIRFKNNYSWFLANNYPVESLK